MNPALIAEIVSLVVQLGPLAVTLIQKIEGLGNLGPDEKANIANAIAAAATADQATLNNVATWMQANGFKAQVSFVKVGQ